MFVPSRSISASSPACEDQDNPRTATIAAVPIAIPSADSAARSGRARSPTLATRRPSLSGRRPLLAVMARGRHRRPPGRPAANLARQLIGEARIVRDQKDGGAGGVELADELDDRCAGSAVEVPGRFVGENDRRMPDEGPGDRNPLPLPSGDLGGLEFRALGEADPFERLIRAPVPLGGGDAGVEQPVGDVLPHRGRFGQEELLEDEPDLPRPQQRQLAVAQPRRVDPTDPDHATAGPLQRPDDVHERGLARPGGADDRHQLARPDGKGHPPAGRAPAAAHRRPWSPHPVPARIRHS